LEEEEGEESAVRDQKPIAAERQLVSPRLARLGDHVLAAEIAALASARRRGRVWANGAAFILAAKAIGNGC